MPRYEYNCQACEIVFDELLLSRDEIEQYKDNHPCPSCREMSPRNYVTAFGFAFKGSVRGTSGVHGNSGVHDLDYPTLDKAVARSSDAKWTKARETQEKIAKARVQSDTGAVSHNSDGTFSPSTTKSLETRESAFKKSKS